MRSTGALPTMGHLARNASVAVSPLVALCLIFGRPWLALGLADGLILSLGACVMLHALTDVGLTWLLPKRGDAQTGGSRGPQMDLALGGKFLAVALAGYLLMVMPHINVFAVLLGFLVAQAAVVLSAARHGTPRPSHERKD